MSKNESYNEFVVYRSYNNLFEAEGFSAFLNQNNINNYLMVGASTTDPLFINEERYNTFQLLIAPENLEKIEDLIEMNFEELFPKIPKDYYLLEFDEEELKQILKEKYKWNIQDYCYAKRLLKYKGIVYTENELSNFNKQNYYEIKGPKSLKCKYVAIGYLLAVFIPFWGVYWGYEIFRMKKELPDKKLVSYYNDDAKFHAFLMIALSVLSLFFWIFVLISKNH